jgi:two-component system, NarL family, nitrate/nitrite response regulator NarL
MSVAKTIERGSPADTVPQTLAIRVLLISHLPLMRASLRFVLEQAGFTVIGEGAAFDDALTWAAPVRPDVIVLDMDFRVGSADRLAELAERGSKCRVIGLGSRGCPHIHQTAVELGASGLVLKDERAEVLVKAILKGYAGEVWLDRRKGACSTRQLRGGRRTTPADLEAAKIATLTAREREIISRVGDGLKNKAIAQRLSISEATVRHHLTSIFSKLDLSDRCELVVYAFRHRLVNYDDAVDLPPRAAISD